MHEIEKIKIIVITESSRQNQKYFNLFRMLLDEKIVEIRNYGREKHIYTSNSKIRFFVKSESLRGAKAHYVLNLSQDDEFHRTRVLSMTTPYDYLKEDEKWSELFNNL